QLRRVIARVVDLEVRTAVRVRVEAGNLERAADRRAEVVARERQRAHGRDHAVAGLEVRRVERRSAERVVRRSLIRALSAAAASAERKAARSALPTAPSATKSASAAAAAGPRLTKRVV